MIIFFQHLNKPTPNSASPNFPPPITSFFYKNSLEGILIFFCYFYYIKFPSFGGGFPQNASILWVPEGWQSFRLTGWVLYLIYHSSKNTRVLRGGGFFSNVYYIRVDYRSFSNPTDIYSYYGFRCVQDY